MLQRKDYSLWILLAANIALLVRHFFFHLPLESVVLGYWTQSVILGFFHVVRIAKYPVSADLSAPKPSKTFSVLFFLFHYNAFHLVYFFMIAVSFPGGHLFNGWGFTFLSFLIAGFAEFKNNVEQDRIKPKFGLDWLFFVPYIRIVPMHLFVFGPRLFGISYLSTFLVLKVAVDMVFYLVVSPKKN